MLRISQWAASQAKRSLTTSPRVAFPKAGTSEAAYKVSDLEPTPAHLREHFITGVYATPYVKLPLKRKEAKAPQSEDSNKHLSSSQEQLGHPSLSTLPANEWKGLKQLSDLIKNL